MSGANTFNLTGQGGFTPAELRAWQFLHYRVLDRTGVLIYLVSPKNKAPDAVVESMGQAMEYLALIGDGDLFAYYAKMTDRFFLAKGKYYYWQIFLKTKAGTRSTALIDDLRLFRAYAIAHDKKLGDYSAKLLTLAKDIYEFDTSEGKPVSFYSAEDKYKDTGVNLFYLDTQTMEQMGHYDERWKKPAQEGRNVLLSIPKNKFGFYPPKFDYEKKAFEKAVQTNMIENLYTALFLHDAGGDTKPLAAFLKNEIAKGRIYNVYNTQTGRPVKDKGESIAVYSLAARLFSLSGEHAAGAACYNMVLAAQIDIGNIFMGGFSLRNDHSVYAFDQLEALLMLRLVSPSGTGGRARQ